jgi:hypothetical protein
MTIAPRSTRRVINLSGLVLFTSILSASYSSTHEKNGADAFGFNPVLRLQSPKSKGGDRSKYNGSLYASKKSTNSGGTGFGGGFVQSSKKKAPSRGKSGRADLISALNDDDSTKKESKSFSRTFVKSDQEKCKR